VRISPLDILKFDGFRDQKREIPGPRWIPTGVEGSNPFVGSRLAVRIRNERFQCTSHEQVI
jgi:hypothetical protein